MSIYVFGPRDKKLVPDNAIVVNTTSSSKDFKGLSPFYLGPCKLYDDHVSQTMENAWQYAKTYKSFVDSDGEIKDAYWNWAQKGWDNPRAERYPMGKGAKPLFSYWKGDRLSYIQARMQIYFPLYKKAVRETEAFERLFELAERDDVWLFDFDGFLTDKSFIDVLLDPSRPMGHAFVLKAMLDYGERVTLRGLFEQANRKLELAKVWERQ